MAHKCTKCGREFADGSNEILRGCPSCGGKKFLFVREEDRHKDVLEEKTTEQLSKETGEEEFEVHPEEDTVSQVFDRVESIRVVNPGSYELNLEKLAESDEMVIGIGRSDEYVVDITSMSKNKSKKHKKR